MQITQEYHKMLRLFRKKAKMTQEEISEELNIPQSTISKMESGRHIIDIQTFVQVGEGNQFRNTCCNNDVWYGCNKQRNATNAGSTYVYWRIYMDLTQINNEIAREKSCIDDLIKLIGMHTQENRLEEAARLGQDLQKSIKTIQKLEQQKSFYITANRLAKQGVICGVVRRYEQKV